MAKKTMSKTLICMGLAGLMTQSVIANTGFYGGAAIGAAALTGDSKLTASRIDPNFIIPEARTFISNFSDKSLNGDLFIGYGKLLNCLFLGIEVIGSLATIKSRHILDISEQAGAETLKAETNGAWGAAARFGYHMNPTSLLYVRLGLESRQFNINFTSGVEASPYINLDKSYRSTAFVPGVGLEVDITPICAVRTEYRLALHRKSKLFQVNDPAIAERFTVTQTKPTIHYFNVGLVVKI